jgi:iron complex outermembrane receptor protein
MDIGTTRLRVGAGVQHVGSRLGETATTFRLPAHTLVRTFANWTLSDRFELYGTVQNLFNTTWYANSFSTLFLQPGTPREATIGIRVKF